jgi:hypothetical protein
VTYDQNISGENIERKFGDHVQRLSVEPLLYHVDYTLTYDWERLTVLYLLACSSLLLIFRTRLSQRLFLVVTLCDEVVCLLTGLRVKTRKKKHTNQVNKGNKMTSRGQYMKNEIVISTEENAYDENKSSLSQGGHL